PAPAATSEAAGVRPSGGVLDALRAIWSEVLGLPADRIGDGDDFFRLGGQSISCILLIARVRQRLGVFVSVEDVFALRTLAELARHLDSAPAHRAEPDPAPAPAAPADAPLTLRANGLQQGLLYHALKSPDGDDAYVMQSVHRYRCALRPELMREAWQHAQRTYPALRLRFEWAEEPLQIIEPDGRPVDWRYLDLSAVSDADEQDARIRELQERDRAEPYDPAAGRLFRVHLVKQRDDLYALVFSCHHLILDGWSLPVLHDDVHRTYLRLLRGEPVAPAADHAYVAAQRYWEEHRDDDVDHWLREVERVDERGDFAGLLKEDIRYRVDLSDYDHVREHRTRGLGLGAERTAALKALCAAHSVTLHSVLQFVWHQVLHAVGGGNTTVVGTIVSGRNLRVDGIENSVGLYINTLPLIVDHDAQAAGDVGTALRAIQSAVNTMNSRSTVELGRLGTGGMKRRLFDTLLVLENYPRLLAEAEEYDELLRFEKAYDADKVDYPLAVVAREEGDELTVTLWYAGELFEDATIDMLLDVAGTLFAQVAEDVTRPVTALEPVSPAMIERFDAWNRTWTPYPDGLTLHAVFERQAAAWPDETAVVYRDTRLTYRELDERANRLAHHLRSVVPLRPDDLVGLVLDKSELMIVAIVAVWKAGAAYVPIDPGYPDDRIAYMLEDTGARLVVANEAHGDRLRALPGAAAYRVLGVEGLPLDEHPADAPVSDVTSTDLAYAIYTSGTTGRPKAVLVEHRGVVNLQTSLAELFTLDRSRGREALLSFSNYVFDHFVEQMTDALLNGQKLVVLDDTMRTDPERLYRYIDDEHVTYLSGTPSVLSLYDWSSTRTLTRIDAIGEDFTEPVFDRIRETFDGTIINGYGPTEISITSHKRPYAVGERRATKSIGHPVANTTAYVLDRHMRRVPVGGLGELCIGGDGVTRGYLHRDDLTAERFVDNPFRTPEDVAAGRNARLYRTGDLVRWLPNGELECLGRTDLQVKIRGQRVELGEVEAVLSAYPGVTRSLVIAREHGGRAGAQKYLVGFCICDPEVEEFDEQDVKQWMRATLPEAIVPARVLRITDIPVTPSGKLDVRRLPETDFGPGDTTEYIAPADDVEIRLCGIWAAVLDVPPDRIGAHDDFFALGGDSIRAMALAQAVTTGFGRGLGVTTVLRHTTLRAQARHIRDAAARPDDAAGAPPESTRLAVTGRPPVSLAQERLLFIEEFEGGTAAYDIPFALRIPADGTLTPDAVAGALRTLVRRHAALRTLLTTDGDGVRRQHVLPEDAVPAALGTPVHRVDDIAALDERLVACAGHVFRLDAELPLKTDLFEVASDPDALYLSLVFHHTCFDGWSWNVFREELTALLRGTPESALGPVGGGYAEHAVGERRYLTGRRLAALTDFWTEALAGHEPVPLPLDRPRPPRFDHRGRELDFTVDEPTTEALRALARSARVSLYSVLLGAWCLMLNAYTGRHDFIVGTPTANRGRPEYDRTIGLFANLLALRVNVDPDATLADYVRAVGERVVAAQVHGELPFEQLVKELALEQDPSRHPLVQVNFTLQNLTADPAPSADGRPAPTEHRPDADGWTATKFDLSATLTETAGGLAGNLTYAASLFDDVSAEGFAATFRHILEEFARLAGAGGSAGLAEVTLVAEAEETAGEESDAAPVPAPAARTLHAVFEEQAAARPDETAVICGDTRLTYRQLDERADRLARRLRTAVALRPGDLVALMLDKSELTVVAILAVWKAGAAYVPIDPDHPDDRVAFMLDDTRARLVITDRDHGTRLRGLPVVDATEDATEDVPTPVGALPPAPEATGADLAYAIYTSGTTGRPKAVRVPHRAVDGFRREVAGRYASVPGAPGGPREGVLFLANYVFDFSVEQLALSVLSGNTLIIPPRDAAHDDAFYAYAERAGLTYLSGTPTQVQQFDLARLPGLRHVLVAGEAFHEHHFDRIREGYAGPIVNAYGTTETAVYNTVRYFAPGEPYRDTLGRPLGNTRLHVLGDAMRPLPPGAVGELYVGGECVADGYLDRPELTAERFLPDPFRTPDERRDGRAVEERRDVRTPVLYRTGDLVRLTHDGELRYIGRNDAQVKINGLRIEPGEVEAVLAACPHVRECAVVATADGGAPGGKRLVGYYTADEGTAVDEDAAFAALRARLMPGMVPSTLVRLDRLPTTVNGKLDTRALPAVDFTSRRTAHTAPRDRAEALLCRLWGELLPGGTVGIDDDFFRSGGDSIGALRLASRVRRETGHDVGVKDVFDHPTVRGFADHVLTGRTAARRTPEENHEAPEQGTLEGDCPLLPVQEWFFTRPLTDRAHWNQTFAVTTPELDPDRLRRALARLAAHHDAFRLRYRDGDGVRTTQFYAPGIPDLDPYVLDVRGLTDEEIRGRLTELQAGFDLEHGPTARAAYLHGYADGSARVWFALHHLLVDTVSWHILAQDLEILYHGGELGEKTASYRQWARALRAYTPDEDERRLWETTVDALTSADAWGATGGGAASHREEFTLPPALTRTLLTESHWAYDTTMNDLLLTATGLALRSVTGREEQHVTVEGHGRERFAGAPDVRATVGWFTTMHPLAVRTDPRDLGRSIVATRDAVRRVPHHGIGYGALHGAYGTERAPLAPVSFNYLGRFADDGPRTPGDGPAPWRLDPALCGAHTSERDRGVHQFAVDVTAHCAGDRLVTVVDSRLDRATTERFAGELRTWLERIVTHTMTVARDQETADRPTATRTPLGDPEPFTPYVLAGQEKEPDHTLFVFPPGEGGAESYLGNIAQRLTGSRLVLFNNVHLHTPMESFEAVADYYLEHVRALRPSGPYSLLGWSFGGIVALEAALRLAREGEKIDHLFLIDPYFDIRTATAAIGLPGVRDVLDPINHHYVPDPADLERLDASTGKVVLFKAGEENEIALDDRQRRLFAHYQRTPYNGLDALLPARSIEVHPLRGATHHSWVRNDRLVAELCARVETLRDAT
ncbi:amino acid adenylation domain-containing protein, partial [Streptomyces sp. URMC 126]|uniref:amino acid adenylation domain-containing protein n=1 Tax=Streptomyces sp. URMC 126 TaxID=3423401 RepID=UPI003F1B0892